MLKLKCCVKIKMCQAHFLNLICKLVIGIAKLYNNA